MSDDIRSVLIDALSIVDSANIPSDLRGTAFAKAVDLLIGKDTPRIRRPSSELPAHHAGSSTSWMQEVAGAIDRDPEELEQLFFAEDDEMPLVGINPTRLGSSAAERTRNVALLLAGVRQVGGIEHATTSELIRKECDRLGVFDTGNFGKTISGLKDWFNITGSGRSKVLRIKPGGRDAFRSLIGELLGDSHS